MTRKKSKEQNSKKSKVILQDKGAPTPRAELLTLTTCRFLPVVLKKQISASNTAHLARTKIRICKWCAGTVSKPRRTFCSEDCVDAWSLRASSSYVRFKLHKRDKGVCNSCGIDTIKLMRDLDPHTNWPRILRAFAEDNGITQPYRMSTEETLLWDCERERILKDLKEFRQSVGNVFLVNYRERRTLWDADHIVRVIHGGGCCGLENYQTLCLVCHSAKTAAGHKKPVKVRVKSLRKFR